MRIHPSTQVTPRIAAQSRRNFGLDAGRVGAAEPALLRGVTDEQLIEQLADRARAEVCG